ncbi:carbohydrate sulfotransferase 5 [Aethina tumida]|uniref:carbohydrate sulfotransferase 5 n=1 Tax=Aethina tumida TaxID=116153 RepID=UPI00096B0714|nr:carbohydrate sulfotransferase 5 [Aethina tumida]
MMRRNEFFSLVVVAILFILLLAFSQRDSNYHRPMQYRQVVLDEPKQEDNSTTLNEIIEQQRYEIRHELIDYKFKSGTNLRNYTLETNGDPIRNIIITTWRSGSTFLGDVMNAVPGNYYHYEPLLHYGIVQIRGAPQSDSALKTLKNLLNCNYTTLSRYLNYGRSHPYLFTHNTRLWNLCEMYPRYCWNAGFLNQVCKLFPFQSMKTVRLRLWLAEDLLNDKKLNIKALLLVRDPRGTIQSRKHRDWCPGKPDCDQPNNLCADMVSDYSAAIQFKKRYPTTFRAIRYEDLSLNPYEHVQDLFKFFGLQFHEQVKMFLDSHTKVNVGGVSSTFRDSKSAPFHWKTDLNATEIQYIEENCEEAMKLWGYVKVTNYSNLKDFNPLTSYEIA